MSTHAQGFRLAALLAGISLATLPWARRAYPEDWQQVLQTLRATELNQHDATLLTRGYYEQLIGVGRLNSQLWEVYMNRPVELEMVWDIGAGRKTGDYLNSELLPSVSMVVNGAVFTTNRWAMRDREYDRVKPAGTFRIAIAGASSTMGWAVGDADTFENLIEDKLNRERRDSEPRYESLNFSRLGFVPPQYWGILDNMLDFQPDVYVLTAQDNELRRTLGRLAYYRANNIPFPDDSMRAVVYRLTEGTTTEAEAQRRLDRHGEMFLTYYYSLIVKRCRERGVWPVWFFLPGLEGMTDPVQKGVLFRSATAAGFTVLDLSDVYAGHNLATLRVTKGDFHPNVAAHRMIAKALYKQLKEHPEIFASAATRHGQ